MTRPLTSLLLLLVLTTVPVQADWTFVRGDANDDANLDVSDAVAELLYLFGGAPAVCLDALDANDDGTVDLADPVYSLSYLFAGGAAPAEPFPACGTDGTPDGLDCTGPLVSCPDGTPPNIVLIVADDFGVDMVSAYAEAAAPPCTPNLDALAAQGMLFRNAWAYPACSPTRAAIQTGRYGFRTGIGNVIMNMTPGLPLSEFTLPEMLVGYDSRYVGKWHLSGNLGNMHPNNSGFADFVGTPRGGVPDYNSWTKVTNGATSPVTNYATTETTDDAITSLLNATPPFFLQVSYNAPHSPWHAPPVSLCPTQACPNSWCGNLPAMPTPAEFVKAMSEAMDTEIGRLLQQIDAIPNTYVIFIGDNGTARQASEPPFLPGHAKGSVYEGGVNVPLIVRGPGVATTECAGLVSCVDLFATFAELAGLTATAVDSVSMVPYFANPTTTIRSTVYSETFTPLFGTMPFTEHDRCVRDSQFKLIRRIGQADEFYDLVADPFETDDLLAPPGPPLTAPQQTAYNDLVAQLVALGVD